MQQSVTVPFAVPEWSFVPSWRNPRVRRLVGGLILTWVSGGAVMFLYYRFGSHDTTRAALVMAVLWMVVVGGISTFSTMPFRRQLQINPYGFYYRYGAFHDLRATWTDIESITRLRWPTLPSEEGILVRREGVPTKLLRPWGKWGRFVPLSLFEEHWQSGEIGELIGRYAPWLLDTLVEHSGSHQ